MIIDGARYPSWGAAASECISGGYHSDSLAELIVEKNVIFRQEHAEKSNEVFDASLANLAVSCLMNRRDSFSCLDFGGGGGFHEYVTRRNASVRNLRWAIVETPQICKHASVLETDNLKWFETIESAYSWLGKADLVFASSVLQYLDDPLSYVDRLIDLRADHILVTRTPLSEWDEPIISVQKSRLSENGPGSLPPGFQDREIRHPITFTPLKDLLFKLDEGYKSEMVYLESLGAIKANEVRINNFYTIFLRRRS
jgi:putative methyltransferase (TIGR04325 family)